MPATSRHVHLMQDWSQAEDVESYLALVYNFTTWLLETLHTSLGLTWAWAIVATTMPSRDSRNHC